MNKGDWSREWRVPFTTWIVTVGHYRSCRGTCDGWYVDIEPADITQRAGITFKVLRHRV